MKREIRPLFLMIICNLGSLAYSSYLITCQECQFSIVIPNHTYMSANDWQLAVLSNTDTFLTCWIILYDSISSKNKYERFYLLRKVKRTKNAINNIFLFFHLKKKYIYIYHKYLCMIVLTILFLDQVCVLWLRVKKISFYHFFDIILSLCL